VLSVARDVGHQYQAATSLVAAPHGREAGFACYELLGLDVILEVVSDVPATLPAPRGSLRVRPLLLEVN
jgi:hypothetical protein